MGTKSIRYFLINVIGLAFLVAGLLVAGIVFNDFYRVNAGSVHFDKNSTFEDLGTVLSGTAGLMFTIAGVLFFTYTLYQTSAEMRQTQSILSSQLSESTFFNLIKHHKDTYTDSEKVFSAFSNEVDGMFNKFEKFEAELKYRFFDVRTTRWQPSSIIIDFKNIKNFADSILHIIRYINSNLKNNSQFYHETLYNNLSQQERIVIGMLIKHRLEKVDMEKFDNYVSAYTVRRPKVVLENLEFPSLSSTLEDFHRKEIVIPSLKEEEAFKIIEKETAFYFQIPTSCKLIGILAFIEAPQWKQKEPLLFHGSHGGDKFDLLPVFKTGILKDINNNESVRIRIVFQFEYEKLIYKVQLCEYAIRKGFNMQFSLAETTTAPIRDRVKVKSFDHISFEQIVHNEVTNC